jgi:superfamily II DNA or RNA helicase
MSSMIRLRPYQQEAIDKIHDAHFAGMKFPAVVLPTGSGKTIIFAHMAAEHLRSVRDRVLILVHRDELADQTIEKLRTVAPHLKIGKVKAGDNDVSADIVVASVQTASLERRLAQLVAAQTDPDVYRPRAIGLVITDEVHHGVSESYKKIYAAFPKARKAGFTATLARADGVGLGTVISDVVFTRSVLWMISKGYLVDPLSREVTAEDLDLSGVKTVARGDYSGASLGQAMIDGQAPEVIARAYLEHASDRQGVIFTPSVASAYVTAAELDKLGITCDVVDADTPREERLAIYERSRTGQLQVIVNCGVLTEGFDAPWLSCVVPRITKSEPLFQQMVGRVLRNFPGKRDALVLSVGGRGGKLRTLVDLAPGTVNAVRQGETLAAAVVREAEEADQVIPASSPAFSLRHRDTDLFAASQAAWLRTDGGVMFIPVTDGEVFLWPGKGGTWQVRHAPRKTPALKARWPRLHDGLSLELAMAWGETEAEDRDHGAGRVASMSSRSASWRVRKEAPTPEQRAACLRWGVTVPDGATRTQVSDLLSVRHASIKFDRYMVRTEPAVSA